MDRRTDLQYEFTTRAVNALGAGPWSGVLNVESGAEDLPNRPSGLEVLSDPAVGSRSFSIAWDMPADNRSEGVLYYELTMTADGIDSERKLYASDITGGGEAGGGAGAPRRGRPRRASSRRGSGACRSATRPRVGASRSRRGAGPRCRGSRR